MTAPRYLAKFTSTISPVAKASSPIRAEAP